MNRVFFASLLLIAVCFRAQPAAAEIIEVSLYPAESLNISVTIGDPFTIVASLFDATTGNPVGPGLPVTIELFSGPSIISGPFNLTTNAAGQSSVTFTSQVAGVSDWLAFCNNCGPNGSTVFSNHAFVTWTAQTTIPEPSSMLLMASGVLGMIVAVRRRRANSASK